MKNSQMYFLIAMMYAVAIFCVHSKTAAFGCAFFWIIWGIQSIVASRKERKEEIEQYRQDFENARKNKKTNKNRT